MVKNKKKTGRPKTPPAKVKGRYLQVRVADSEKKCFDTAADLAGLPLSSWVRNRLRSLATKELKEYGKTADFLEGK